MSNWTFFSNHGHVLFCLANDPEARLRDVAADVGITERAVQKIVRDLQDGGMISISKHGRRNRYRIYHQSHLRHALEAHRTLGDLVNFVSSSNSSEEESAHRGPSTGQSDLAETSGNEPVEAVSEQSGASEQFAPENEAGEPGKRQQGTLF